MIFNITPLKVEKKTEYVLQVKLNGKNANIFLDFCPEFVSKTSLSHLINVSIVLCNTNIIAVKRLRDPFTKPHGCHFGGKEF